MSLWVWIPVCLRWKTHFANPPWACDTSLEPSRQKKSIHEKKSHFARAPAARKNVLRSLHKLHQNDFLELQTIKIK